jgi:hypothetical protein
MTSSATKKKSAPNAPANQSPIYGTLPHTMGRNQQNYDLSDVYSTNSTLPHPARNSMIENRQNNNNASTTSVNSKTSAAQQPPHFDNKVYERFEPYMMQQSNKASHKRSPSSDSISSRINLGNILKLKNYFKKFTFFY